MVQWFNWSALQLLGRALAHRRLLCADVRAPRLACALRHVPPRVAALLVDVDNTLARPYTAQTTERAAARARARLCAAVAPLWLCSNDAGSSDDVALAHAAALERALGVPVLHHCAKKPAAAVARAALEALRVPAARVAVIGDRRWTDVLLARQHGFVAVLVAPLARDCDPPVVRLARRFEDWLVGGRDAHTVVDCNDDCDCEAQLLARLADDSGDGNGKPDR